MNSQIDNQLPSRDSYIDFLRAFGLLLLVVAHTCAPQWLFNLRTFDVPLMVFISAICYNPLRGWYLAYCKKRLKRIYNPVLAFLTLFFVAEFGCFMLTGRPHIEWETVLGSYFLLNSPSIGYVWIMRVFLMMALVLPLLHKVLIKANFLSTCIVIGILLIAQHFLVTAIQAIPYKGIRFVLDEIIPYATGYSAIAILGLKIRIATHKDLLLLMFASLVAIVWFVYAHDMEFDPQAYKYPPQSLYLLYGIFASTLLWSLKPFYKAWKGDVVFRYLSANSMWIYLWHIIPVMVVARWAEVPGLWGVRYVFVLVVAVALNASYAAIIKRLRLSRQQLKLK